MLPPTPRFSRPPGYIWSPFDQCSTDRVNRPKVGPLNVLTVIMIMYTLLSFFSLSVPAMLGFLFKSMHSFDLLLTDW